MILLESGPARVDRTYWFVVTLVCIGFAGWFLWDGGAGYYNKNRKRAEQELPRFTTLSAQELGRSPTPEDFDLLKQLSQPTREQVHERLGRPLPPRDVAATKNNVEHFASLYGLATVRYDPDGRAIAGEMRWDNWAKSKDEIQQQFWWALIPGLMATWAIFKAYKAQTLRAVIDEQGLTYGGLRIPFAAMVSLRDYNRKGWVDLYYQADDREKRLRIDNQKIAKFNEIAEVICQKTGFTNPISTERGADDEAEPAEPPTGENPAEAVTGEYPDQPDAERR